MAGFLNHEKLQKLFSKYKYAVIVVAVGVALMLIPWGSGDKAVMQQQNPGAVTQEDLERDLESLLSSVKGAGRVEVLLTQAAGARKIYQTDREDSENSARTNTVILVDGERAENALVTQTIPPEYLGAVVVCEGAADPKVRLAIVEAVSKATGLGADRITVLKMK
jgi:stage III sporulation protein AG